MGPFSRVDYSLTCGKVGLHEHRWNRGRIQRITRYMGPYARVDYSLTCGKVGLHEHRGNRGRIQRKTWRMGPLTITSCVEKWDYMNTGGTEAKSKEKHGVWDPVPELTISLTLCPLRSRLQHIYHGQLYARVDLNPCQGLLIWPQGVPVKKKYVTDLNLTVRRRRTTL
jgi:hypothetical protein